MPLRIAAIFARHGDAYRASYPSSTQQCRVIRDILACRTAALGGHLQVCGDCQEQVPLYNSCRNRHCPTCQGARQAKWLTEREQTILPTPYFHVVFTLPQGLRDLLQRNSRTLLGLLMRCAADTLLTLGCDPKRLGARLGITTVLHTWTRTLVYHPHVHCIVTSGGLSLDGKRWVRTKDSFLFASEVVQRLFRGRFMAALRQLYAEGKLFLDGPLIPLRNPAAFRALKESLYEQRWVVYTKAPFGGVEQVFAYLGRHTHRVGLTDSRLRAVTADSVTFATKMARTTTVTPVEFLRRFLLHVLPKGFVKIRHYGLYAGRCVRESLPLARALLSTATPPSCSPHESARQGESDATIERSAVKTALLEGSWQDRLKALSGIDVTRCRRCGSARLEVHALPRGNNTS